MKGRVANVEWVIVVLVGEAGLGRLGIVVEFFLCFCLFAFARNMIAIIM